MNLTARDKKHLCTQIISETFASNPSVNISIGSVGNRARKIRRLSEYVYAKARVNNGAYLSDNGKGAALIYRSDKLVFSWSEMWYELKFALSLSPVRVLQLLKREAYLKKHRYQGAHIYFWFLGVQQGGGHAAFELKQLVFDRAKIAGLPILLETSVWRNVQAYQRYGFVIYHEWKDDQNGITLWFMKKG